MLTQAQAIDEVNKAFPHLTTLYARQDPEDSGAMLVMTWEADHNFYSDAVVYHDGKQIVVDY